MIPDRATVEKIEYQLRKIAFLLRRQGRRILTRFDLTPPQFDALQFLIYHDGLTMGELTQRLYLASSTVTDLIQRMEKGELVKRVRDPRDRRVVRLYVQPRAHEVLEAVLEERRRFLARVLGELSPEVVGMLEASLEKLHDQMGAALEKEEERQP
ncbi:MAG: MarR family transcriptional regulator [Clostridiales bacterium]|nr:MarR family transcriptional regulator [Clostridiales bacterium]